MRELSFENLFKASFKKMKDASKGLWILVIIMSMFVSMGLVMNNVTMDSAAINNGQYINQEAMFVEDEDKSISFEKELMEVMGEDEAIEFLESLDNNSTDYFDAKDISIIVIGFVIGFVVSVGVALVYQYFVYKKTIECVDATTLQKGNFGGYISSQLLMTLMMMSVFCIGIASVMLIGSALKAKVAIAVVMLILFSIVSMYISLRYFPSVYVAIKNSELNGVEVLKQSAKVSKGYKGRFLGYTIILGLLSVVMQMPTQILSNVLNGTVATIILFLISVIIYSVYFMFMNIFAMLFASTISGNQETIGVQEESMVE